MRNRTSNNRRGGGRGFENMGRDRQREISGMGGRASHGGRDSRRESDYDDDRSYGRRDSGQGWYGDSEGHSEAAERGWESRRGGSSRGGSDYDEDRGGRSSYSSRGSSRYDDYEDRPYGRSGQGWYGDSEGHSEAAERGWENRRGGSSREEDYDDYDRDNYSGRSRSQGGNGRGGWFGDSEGHAEAAERGWENRRGGADRGGSRGSSSGRGGHGHGGWFGDSEGHSRAAEEGWENRR